MAAEMQQLVSLLEGMASPNNDTRKQAEHNFEEAKNGNISGVAAALFEVLAAGSVVPPTSRQLAGVLLRRMIERRAGNAWPNLSEAQQAAAKATILQQLSTIEPQDQVRTCVIHLMAEVAAMTLQDGLWRELLPGVFQLANSSTPAHREVAFECFDKIAEYAADAVRPHSEMIRGILSQGLLDTAPDSSRVRIAALRAISSLLLALETDAQLKPFKELVPSMIMTLQYALQENEAAGREGLRALVELAEEHPKFLRHSLNEVAQTISTIVGAPSLENDTRQIGLELALTITESASTMVRRNAALVNLMIPQAFSLIAEGASQGFDVAAWDAAEGDDEDAGIEDDEALSDFGEEAIDRMSRALGGKTVLPVANKVLPEFLHHADWRYRRAACLGIAMLAEGCGKVFYQQMGQVVNALLPCLLDVHPRVRIAAIQALGQISIDFGEQEACGKNKPTFQQAEGAKVLPCLIALLGETIPFPAGSADAAAGHQQPQPWRVRGRAASALVCFFNLSCEASLLRPVADDLMEKLFGLVQQGPTQVKEESLSAIANAATVLEEEFGKYYEHFMPLAKEVVEGACTPEMARLRGKAMECISLMGIAVGKERFVNDAKFVMEMLLRVSKTGQNDVMDSVTMEYFTRACARICSCLEEEFVPYMEMVLPPLIAGASREVDLKEITDDEAAQRAAKEQGMETVRLPMRGRGELLVAVNTSAIDEKLEAVGALYVYADALKAKFFPFVDAVSQALVPLLTYALHDDVRIKATCAMPRLLNALSLGLRERNATDFEPAQTLLLHIIPSLLENLRDPDYEIEELLAIAECLAGCLQVACESGGLDEDNSDQALELSEARQNGANSSNEFVAKFGIPANVLDHVFEQIVAITHQRVQARKDRQDKARGDEDFDEDEMMWLAETEEKEEELVTSLVDAIGYIIKTHRASIIPAFDKVLHPASIQFLGMHSLPRIMSLAICMYDDVFEFGGQEAQKYVDMVSEAMVQCSRHADTDLRQSAVFGLGVLAQFGGPDFDKYVQSAMTVLGEVMTDSTAREGENDRVFDNAVSSLHKLATYRSHCGVDPAQVLPHWLSALPSKSDVIEARVNHFTLLRFAESMDTRVLGAQGENMPRVVSIFAQAIVEAFDEAVMTFDEEEATCTVKTRQGIVRLMNKMEEGNAPMYQACMAGLTEEQRCAFKTVMDAVVNAAASA